MCGVGVNGGRCGFLLMEGGGLFGFRRLASQGKMWLYLYRVRIGEAGGDYVMDPGDFPV